MTIHLDKKSVAIAILSLSAAIMLIADLSAPRIARAETVKGDQYTAVTGRLNIGGDGLYLTNRDGMMAVFVYNPARKQVEPRAVKSLLEAFNGAPAPVRNGRNR